MTTFVTGGTGFVGSHIVRELVARGQIVRCLVRTGSRLSNLDEIDPAKLEIAVGDLSDPRLLESYCRGCDVVYHCAADYRLFAHDPKELYDTNVEGTGNVLSAAAKAGVPRIVYTSSVGALVPSNDGTPVDEDAPSTLEGMVGHYKRSKFLAERVAEELAQQGKPIIIVSPTTPVGELDLKPTPTGQIIVDFLNRRLPATVDTGLNLIDVRDVAVGHLAAAEKGTPGERYILGHQDMTLLEILQLLAEITGLEAPRVRLPHWLPISVAAIDTSLARLLRRTPRVPLESALMARKKMYFESSKAVRELALPQSSIRAALERAVWWFTSEGYVTRGPLADSAAARGKR